MYCKILRGLSIRGYRFDLRLTINKKSQILIKGGCDFFISKYDLFYERMVDGISAEQHIINMFTNRSSIENFLDTAYDFIDKNKEVLM